MVRCGLLALALAALPLSGASALTNNFHYDKGALSGRKSLLGLSSEVDINCHPIASRPPIIIEQPEHGRLIFSQGLDYPRFNSENPHYKCIYKKIPGTRIYYQSEAGYTGNDHFEIEDISSLGDINVSSFDVIVR